MSVARMVDQIKTYRSYRISVEEVDSILRFVLGGRKELEDKAMVAEPKTDPLTKCWAHLQETDPLKVN